MRMTTAINDVSTKTFLRGIARAQRFQVPRCWKSDGGSDETSSEDWTPERDTA